MNLTIQIYSFLYSFLFGIFFKFLLDLFYMFIVKCKFLLNLFLSFLFIFILSVLYFTILLFINNGVLHIYFLIMIMVGYFFANIGKRFWFTLKK